MLCKQMCVCGFLATKCAYMDTRSYDLRVIILEGTEHCYSVEVEKNKAEFPEAARFRIFVLGLILLTI